MMTACPKCEGETLERREGMFYWRGDIKPGMVCLACNALWPVKGEEIEPLRHSPKGRIDE